MRPLREAPFLCALVVLGMHPVSLSSAEGGTHVPFVEVTAEAGITFVHDQGATPEKRMPESFGSGLAWIDYDNDDFPDLFFVSAAEGSSNALYHNNRDGTFTDVTAQAGVGGDPASTTYKTGIAVGDYDNDGYLDLYATAFGPNTLYRNNGDGTFTDVTAAAGVAGSDLDWSTSTGFFDYDNDGDLDLYVVNYLEYRNFSDPYCGFKKPGYRMYCDPTNFDAQADRLFRNNGDGTFADVSREAGIANPGGKGLGIALCDFDLDGYTDAYVANDMVRNFLYRNLGDGTFQDVSYGTGVGFDGDGMPQAGMGAHCRDFDGDGWPDLWVTNYSDELNTLYRNTGEGLLFEDVSAGVGLLSSYLPLGFGTKMFDFDNDGDLDIYVTNGHVVDNVELYRPDLTYAQKDLLYENIGNGRFRDISKESGPAFQLERVGRGLAVDDYDNDGDLDVAILNQGQAAVLLRNEAGAANNWISIKAVGKADNRFGIGAKVRIQAGGKQQTSEINNVGSYQSAHGLRLYFGLGAAKLIDEITLEWPSGTTQVLTDVTPNQFLTIEQP